MSAIDTDPIVFPVTLPPGSRVKVTAKFRDPIESVRWLLQQLTDLTLEPLTVRYGLDPGRFVDMRMEVWLEGCTPDPEEVRREQAWLNGEPPGDEGDGS